MEWRDGSLITGEERGERREEEVDREGKGEIKIPALDG